ncbi:MAG: hypothetical protein QOI00_163 [Chloroflexota bacterium]|nr:hypothetical protein [Chloroflexota bacterium]
MVLNVPALRRRSVASLALATVLGVAILLPGAAVATTTTVDAATLTATETAMVSALNADRAARGLVAVRTDARLMAIARARSDDMVANAYFSHIQPNGQNVFDILTAQHLTWFNAGEIIARNNYPMDVTVNVANRQWLESPGHYAIITSSDLNYVGVGLALRPDTGEKIWTAVFIKGPDRTGARATAYTPKVTVGSNASTRTMRWSWTGADVRLQVLTAGLRSYAVQRRVDGGSWTTTFSSTTLKAASFTLHLGHRYEFRVSARDRAGNRGAWVTKVIDLR